MDEYIRWIRFIDVFLLKANLNAEVLQVPDRVQKIRLP